jgi:hypothetical protein
MEPSSPNDLAFFYLYDYTTPPRHHRRTHRRTTSHSPTTTHLEKATTRRTLHLEAKRTKVATHNENIRHVLAQYKVDDEEGRKRLSAILDRMARADGNRHRLLQITAQNCGRRVEEAKIRARKVKKERDEVAAIASREILERLENAEKRREELLSNRGRRSPPVGRSSPTATANRRVSEQMRVDAAMKIQRVWRRRRMRIALKDFQGLRISVDSVTSHSFEQVVSRFKSAMTIRIAARLLTVLGLIPHGTPEKEINSLVRTFLSAYMILGHTTEVLHSHDQPLEMVLPLTQLQTDKFQDLTSKARTFLTSFDLQSPNLSTQWQTYLSAFQEWKSHDASILVEMLVGKFVELDSMLLDIQDSSAMTTVVEEYFQAIKSGQMLLLTKVRRLVGDETRNMVRRAVQAGRRRRLQLQQQQQQNPVQAVVDEPANEELVGEIVEPPTSSHGLSNRRIMHELAINPDYEITAPKKSEEQRLQEDTFKQAFYETLESSLRNSDQLLLPPLIHDVKFRLLSLLQPSTPSYTSLSTHLDETIVQQECQRGIFDRGTFLDYVQNTMKQLCAPIRDSDVLAISSIVGIDDIITFVLRVQRIMEVLGIMALDSANFHLRIARPALLSQALQYERKKFAEQLEAKQINLNKTTQWIESAIQPTDQLTSGAIVFRRAFIDLLFTEADIPETFEFDIDRISSLRTKIRNTVTLAALLLISRTFTAANNTRQLDYLLLAQRLRVILDSSAENIQVEIDRFITSPPATVKRDLLLSMIRRVKSDLRDPCVLLLQRRVNAILTAVLNGGEVTGLAAMGLGEVEVDVREITQLVGVLGRVNWGCYREWYEDIVRGYLERIRE